MEQFLIVCPLVFLAGFVDSIAGGGGLISFPAYMLAGVPVHVILGTSKLSAFPGSIVLLLICSPPLRFVNLQVVCI